MEKKFERKLEQSVIDRLNENDLWKDHLKADCKNEGVFFAIRNNNIGFYHKGGRLFRFDEKDGFKTHIKYASVIEKAIIGDYLTQEELKESKLISDFSSNYKRIQENCALYSGEEAQGVSEIYHKYSYLSSNKIIVLDIEVSFEAIEKENGQDRIDILLFDTETKTLKFVEAKHFSNSEIWSKTTPKVIEQIEKYEKQIKVKKTEIIKAYTEYVKIVNNIFDTTLPPPVDVEDKVTLLIFGFDRNQQQGRLKELIKENSAYNGHIVYDKGDIKTIILENLWKEKPL